MLVRQHTSDEAAQDDSAQPSEALRSGCPRAFETVYRAESQALYGFLLRLAGDSDVAADLFQNVWLKLARSLLRMNESTHVRGWLYTVARREYISYRRAQVLDVSRLLLGNSPPDHSESQADAMFDLTAALGRLRDPEREVLVLVGTSGLSTSEIAGVLQITEPALRQRVARARARLQLALEQGCLLDAVRTGT